MKAGDTLQAIIAMRHLAANARNRIKTKKWAGNPLLRLADSTNVEVQRGAACLRNLSLGEQVKVALVRAGCLKARKLITQEI